jgi:ACS family hexuronate transporter-like MFS transporter
MVTAGKPIASLRWWIGGLLLASTVINYIDRQNIAIAFRVAYSIGQTAFGRLMDRIGTRRGLTLTVIWYSLVSMLTSLASGFYSFATFRFLLGAGESANWPAATKGVAEWFPKPERARSRPHFLIAVLRLGEPLLPLSAGA